MKTIRDVISEAARRRIDPRELVAQFNAYMERETFRRMGQLLTKANEQLFIADDRDRLIDEARD